MTMSTFQPVMKWSPLVHSSQCQYSFPVETLHDVRRVRAVYKDLRLHVDFYRKCTLLWTDGHNHT